MPDAAPKPDELPPGNDRLRLGIALLGAALPPVLYTFGLVFGGVFPRTMSDFYYLPPASTFFIGILWANGVFLILYRGYSTVPPGYRVLPAALARQMTDANLSSIAGFAMILTAVVPTCAGTCGALSYATVHFLAAFACLGTLAVIALFSFTASDTPPAAQTAFRRRSTAIYRICGVVILAALAVIGGLKFLATGYGAAIFWLEALAVWAFAFSWLRKAMPDPEETGAG